MRYLIAVTAYAKLNQDYHIEAKSAEEALEKFDKLYTQEELKLRLKTGYIDSRNIDLTQCTVIAEDEE